MDSLTIALIVIAAVVIILAGLAIYTLIKYIRARYESDIIRGVKTRPSYKQSIDFSVPVSYRAVKAQTPFLQNEEPYPTLDDHQSASRPRPVRPYSMPDLMPTSAQVPPEQRLVELLPTNAYRDPVPLTSFDKTHRKISLGVLEHLSKQGRKVSSADLRATITDEMFNEPFLNISRPSSVFGEFSDTESSVGTPASEDIFGSSSIGLGKRRLAERRLRVENGSAAAKPKRTFKKSGKITFTTMFISHERSLYVHIIRVIDIGSKRDVGEINPFVRLYLLPGKKQKQNTNYTKATKEPFFNETIIFTDIDKEEIHRYRLMLKVFNYSRMRKNESLGVVDVALSSIDTEAKETFNLDLFLQRSESSLASLKITLCHNATSNKLEVTINEAKHLPKFPSSYVTISLFREQSIERKETTIKRNTRDPVYNETVEFDVCADYLKPLTTFTLVATINNVTLVGKDEVIGHVIFSLTSPQKSAAEHWKRVQDSPHKHDTDWHSLIDPDEL